MNLFQCDRYAIKQRHHLMEVKLPAPDVCLGCRSVHLQKNLVASSTSPAPPRAAAGAKKKKRTAAVFRRVTPEIFQLQPRRHARYEQMQALGLLSSIALSSYICNKNTPQLRESQGAKRRAPDIPNYETNCGMLRSKETTKTAGLRILSALRLRAQS